MKPPCIITTTPDEYGGWLAVSDLAQTGRVIHTGTTMALEEDAARRHAEMLDYKLVRQLGAHRWEAIPESALL